LAVVPLQTPETDTPLHGSTHFWAAVRNVITSGAEHRVHAAVVADQLTGADTTRNHTVGDKVGVGAEALPHDSHLLVTRAAGLAISQIDRKPPCHATLTQATFD
jgi:hypothetical protein